MRREYLNRTPKPRINLLIVKIIENALKQIKIDSLKQSARISLVRFYNRQYAEISRLTPTTLEVLAVAGLLLSGELKPNHSRITALRAKGIFIENYTVNVPNANLYGVPLRKFQEDYLRDNVKPVFDRLIKDQPRDPNDLIGRNSLRNLAEMEVRYNDHLQQIDGLKAAGHKLVIASTHADCSDRCRPWQGRVYSLDGTYGTTDDGRKYEPLENATDVLYTTKAGKTYKNGLLGFNCFDDKTEVMTSRGWQYFKDLTTDDLIYTLNTETQESEWQLPTRYYKQEHNGEMVYIHSATTDLCVTENHDLLFFTQKDKTLRFKAAREYSTATFMYAGQKWTGENPKTITLGNKEVDTALYCKFMAYYLADGSLHSDNAVKIAQQNNETMFNELQNLPFKVWRDNNKIVIYGKDLHDELKQFGTCTEKFVPEIIKSLAKEYIQEFINGYLATDGYTAKESYINGKQRKPHKTLFTTSKQMSADLCELALKCGYRPSYTVQKGGKTIEFRNGKYLTNYDCYIIHLNRRVNITHATKETIQYKGFVYCVEVPNHTLLVRRRNRVQWCGNCRHFLIPYKSGYRFPKPNAEEERKQYAITLKQREYERNVRHWRTEALTTKGIDEKRYTEARKKAIAWNNAYIEYSRKNKRAYYPSRTKII